MNKLRRAVTIVELLVVVAIVGLLAAVVIPAISHARQRTATTRCAAALREVSASMLFYAADEQALPAVDESWRTAIPATMSLEIVPEFTFTWVDLLHRSMHVDASPWLRALACPNVVDNDPTLTRAKPGDAGSAWIYNWYAAGRSLSSVPTPSDGVLLFESGVWDKFAVLTGNLAFPNEPIRYPHPRAIAAKATAPWRWPESSPDRQTQNIAWLDGHVSNEAASQWPTGDQVFDDYRIRHMRFGLPGQAWFDR